MKKFLLSLVFAAVLGSTNQAGAQCAGANVTITNIIVNQTATHFVYQFIWTYVSGNASIQVRVRCGPNVGNSTNWVYEGRCFPFLTDSTAGPHFVKDSIAISLVPTCAGGNARVLVVGVRASSNCNGTFCEIPGGQIPLPVKFASFTATRSGSNVNIAWSTASEQNNSGFAVERNVNGVWEQIAFIPTQAQNGNSDAALSYSFADQNNAKGISQYRIRQIDFNSKSQNSEIRSVRGNGQLGKTIVYPNPSNNGKVNVVFEDASITREVTVSDLSGRIVRQVKGITNNNLTIENLQPGMYMIRIVAVGTGEQMVEKVVVNKQ